MCPSRHNYSLLMSWVSLLLICFECNKFCYCYNSLCVFCIYKSASLLFSVEYHKKRIWTHFVFFLFFFFFGIKPKKYPQLPVAISKNEAVSLWSCGCCVNLGHVTWFLFPTIGKTPVTDKHLIDVGATLWSAGRAAWWDETLLFAASLAWIWCHRAREFNEMLQRKF